MDKMMITDLGIKAAEDVTEVLKRTLLLSVPFTAPGQERGEAAAEISKVMLIAAAVTHFATYTGMGGKITARLIDEVLAEVRAEVITAAGHHHDMAEG